MQEQLAHRGFSTDYARALLAAHFRRRLSPLPLNAGSQIQN